MDNMVQKGWGLIPASYYKLRQNLSGGGSSAQPYDESFYSALNQLQSARQTYLSNLRASKLLSNEGYHQSMHDMVKQHPYDIGSLNDNYGASGLGFSSGYGGALGRLQDLYTTNTGRLRQAHLDALTQVRLNHQNYMNEFRTNKAALRQAAADRLSAQAGNLGLGSTSKATTLSNKVQGNANG